MSVRFESVIIANGAAVSGTLVTLPGELITGVITPAIWTAADIGFKVSNDSSTFYHVVDPNRGATTSHARIVNVEVSKYFTVPSALDLEVGHHIQLTSINTASNADVNQGGARTLIVAIEKSY